MGQVADLLRSTQARIECFAGRRLRVGQVRRETGDRGSEDQMTEYGVVGGVQQPHQRHEALAEGAKPQEVPTHRKEHPYQQRAQTGKAVANAYGEDSTEQAVDEQIERETAERSRSE